jgi:hypothetical protein
LNLTGEIVPTYCHSCPYNKFCKDFYISNPTCPHGYSPVRQEDGGPSFDSKPSSQRKGTVLDPTILFNIGKAASNRNDYETALLCYEKVLEKDLDNTKAAFLLKRLKYILEEDKPKEPETEDEDGSSDDEETSPKEKGMLPLQEQKNILIKPKMQFEIDPELRTREPVNVYRVEETDEDEELSKVSRDVAIQERKADTKRKRNMGLAAGIVVIFMMIMLLYWFGYLKF